MEELVKKAETEMYEAKRIFYENGGRERRKKIDKTVHIKINKTDTLLSVSFCIL